MLGRSHTLKSARLKERRRKVVIGKIVLSVICVGGLWGLIFWLAGLSAITIRGVEVWGTVSVSAEALVTSAEKFLSGRYLFTIPRANILFYPKEIITQDIFDSYPRVEKAEVRFKNFNTIHVAIVEREAAALWCRSLAVQEVYLGESWDECFLLDKEGFVFDKFDPSISDSSDVLKFKNSSRSPAYVKFYGGLSSTTDPVRQTYASPERFQTLLMFADTMGELGWSIIAYRERSDRDLDVELTGGGRLVVSSEPDIPSVVSNLQSVISEPDFEASGGIGKIDYIDMRFGNKVFYKLK
ncbi:MAG: hypothetical protein Q7S86_05205 [bacterium]|nr:hypothetical protein [bacterium]